MTHPFHPPAILAAFAILPLATAPAQAEWGTQPLGEAIEIVQNPPPVIKRKLETRFLSTPVDTKPLPLIEEGKITCLIIQPASPNASEKSAIRLLTDTLEAATGEKATVASEYAVKLTKSGTVVDGDGKEWKQALWIGHTQAATKEQITADDLAAGGFRRVLRGGALYVIGNDTATQHRAAQGTYFAVADLLERHLGVRWLWPGEGGTVVPRMAAASYPAVNEQDEPALAQRIIRNGALNDRAEAGLKLIKAEPESYLAVLDRNEAWLRNLKTGSSIALNYRHAYGRWYELYGKEHPSWFSLRKDGTRTQVSSRPRLCKSNPEVIAAAARQVLKQYEENPNMDSASLSPNDGSGDDGFCLCEACRKLDPKNGPLVHIGYSDNGKRVRLDYVSLSDRVGTFYNRIAEAVVKEKPEARLGAYAYSAYRDVPLGVKLHPAIILGFVGLDYTNDSVREADLARWDGWSHHAHELLLRPNALGGGFALPFLYPHRLAKDVKHCYETGMAFADFDSLAGHWSTQGLNYYILAKVLWDPSIKVDTIIDDYCQAGFGPAAPKIKEYFSRVEAFSDEMAQLGKAAAESTLRPEEDDNVKPIDPRIALRNGTEQHYFASFSLERMAELRELLKEANTLAKGDAAIQARIAFLGLGLDYSDVYRATLAEPDALEPRKAFLDWYRQTYATHPHAINGPTRLWRTGAQYRKVKSL